MRRLSRNCGFARQDGKDWQKIQTILVDSGKLILATELVGVKNVLAHRHRYSLIPVSWNLPLRRFIRVAWTANQRSIYDGQIKSRQIGIDER